jgi:lipoprotein-releasing system permease protein
LIIVLTIIISTLAGLLPAWRAARLKPVEALRSE